MDTKSFSELISEILTSADEVASLAKGSEIESETITEFSVFVEKLTPILSELKDNNVLDTHPIRKAVESFETDLQRAKTLISSPNCSSPAKQIEDVTHDLGRSLGLVLFASHDVSVDGKEKIETLRREMMNARFDSCSDRGSEFVNDVEIEEDSEEEIVEEGITLDIDDVVLQLKYGNDEEFKCALLGLSALIRDHMITNEWINDEGIIPILFNRLGSSKPNNRLTIIRILRSLAAENAENKCTGKDGRCWVFVNTGEVLDAGCGGAEGSSGAVIKSLGSVCGQKKDWEDSRVYSYVGYHSQWR